MNDRDVMHPSRRRFLQTSALGAAALPVAMLGGTASGAESSSPDIKLPASILALKPVTSQIVPISDDERRARLGESAEVDGQAQAGRHLHGRRQLARLLHRHALVDQRTHD